VEYREASPTGTLPVVGSKEEDIGDQGSLVTEPQTDPEASQQQAEALPQSESPRFGSPFGGLDEDDFFQDTTEQAEGAERMSWEMLKSKEAQVKAIVAQAKELAELLCQDVEDDVEIQVGQTAEGTVEETAKAEETVEGTAEETVEVKAEETVEAKAEETVEAKAEETVEAKAEETVEAKAEEKEQTEESQALATGDSEASSTETAAQEA